MRSIGLTVSSRSCFSSSGKLTNDERRSAKVSGPSLMFIRRMFSSSFEYFESLSTSFSKSEMRLVHQAVGLDALRNRTRRDLAQHPFEVRLALEHLHELDALPPLQEELIAIGRQRQTLHDRREHADLREILGARILLVARSSGRTRR